MGAGVRDAFPPPMCCVVVVFIYVWKRCCVPARAAPQGRICRSSPAHNTYILGMETPPCGRSGGHTGVAPTVSFGQIACGWLISFGWIMRGRLVSFGWIVCKWLFCLCGIVWKNMMEFGRGGACVPARVAPRGRIHRSSSHGLASCYAKKAVHECGAQLFLWNGLPHRGEPTRGL